MKLKTCFIAIFVTEEEATTALEMCESNCPIVRSLGAKISRAFIIANATPSQNKKRGAK